MSLARLSRNWFIVILTVLSTYVLWMGGSLARENVSNPERSSSLYGWDTSFYYFWLRSVVLDGDVDFSNEIEICNTLPSSQRQWALEDMRRTDKGLVANKYAVGWAVFHAPWFLLGHGVAVSFSEMGYEVRTDGFGKVYEASVYIGSLMYAVFGFWISWRLLRRYFSREASFSGALTVWLGGFLVYYQLNQFGMAHNLTYMWVAAVFYCSLAIVELPPYRLNWIMLGLSVGGLLITRYQAGVYLLFPFILAVRELLTRRAPLRCAVACLLPMCLVVSIQLVAWKALYGSWLTYSYQGEGFNWSNPAIIESLFDPFHGLLYWHPIFGLGFVTLVGFVLWKREPLLWLWPLSWLLMVYVNSAWENWWFGASFGARAYEGITLFACFGFAWIYTVSEKWSHWLRQPLRIVVLAVLVWNVMILELSIFNWRSGLSMEEPIRYRDFWDAFLRYWFE